MSYLLYMDNYMLQEVLDCRYHFIIELLMLFQDLSIAGQMSLMILLLSKRFQKLIVLSVTRDVVSQDLAPVRLGLWSLRNLQVHS